MTGGGTGACLTTTEAGGMGEGWSDAMAFWLEQTDATVRDYPMGVYVYGQSASYLLPGSLPLSDLFITPDIRSHPYSTSKTVNPLTYHSIATLNEVHGKQNPSRAPEQC